MDKQDELFQIGLAIAPVFTQRSLMRAAPAELTPEELAQYEVRAARENAYRISLWSRFIVQALETQDYAQNQTSQRELQIRHLEEKIAHFKIQLDQAQKGVTYPNLPEDQRAVITQTIERKIREFEGELAHLQAGLRDLRQADTFLRTASPPGPNGQALDCS